MVFLMPWALLPRVFDFLLLIIISRTTLGRVTAQPVFTNIGSKIRDGLKVFIQRGTRQSIILMIFHLIYVECRKLRLDVAFNVSRVRQLTSAEQVFDFLLGTLTGEVLNLQILDALVLIQLLNILNEFFKVRSKGMSKKIVPAQLVK